MTIKHDISCDIQKYAIHFSKNLFFDRKWKMMFYKKHINNDISRWISMDGVTFLPKNKDDLPSKKVNRKIFDIVDSANAFLKNMMMLWIGKGMMIILEKWCCFRLQNYSKKKLFRK